MLASDQIAIQLAAGRAMAQIGGKEAHPAVAFLVSKMKGASETDLYNTMVYLALLGPDAAEAIPAVQNSGLVNPIIPAATVWAIKADSYPCQTSGFIADLSAFGSFDFAAKTYEAYMRELGERLRPLASSLAQSIMDGTASEIPTWGYKLLACAPNESTSKLTAYLGDTNIAVRERAAVAIGYMGPARLPAKDQVAGALNKAATEPERRLLQWCLRRISS